MHHLLTKIRRCKTYLVSRLKAIEDAGETEYLSDEVEELNYWLEIANDVRADLTYGSETIEVVHDQITDYVRRNPPIEGAFSGEEIDKLDQIKIDEFNYSPPSFEIDTNPEPSYDDPIEDCQSSSWAGENYYDISRTGGTSTTMDNVARSRDTPTSIPRSVSGHQGITAAAPFSRQLTDQLDSDSEWSRDDKFPNMLSFDDQDRRSISRDPRNYNRLQQPFKTPSPSPGRVQTPINFQQQSIFHSQRFPFNHHSLDFAPPSNNFRHVPPPFDPSRASTRLSGSNYGTSTIIDHRQHHAVRGNSNQIHFNMRAAGQEAQVDMNEIKQKAKQHFAKNKPHRYFQQQIFPINAPRSVVTSKALANQPLPPAQDNENRQLDTTTTSCSNESVNKSQNTGGIHLLKGVLETTLEGLKNPISADQSVEGLKVILQVLNNAMGITDNNKHSPEKAQPTEETSTGAAAKNKRKPKSSAPPRGRGTKAPVNGKKELQNLKSPNRKKPPKKKIVKIPTRKNVAGKRKARGTSSSTSALATEVDQLIHEFVLENFGEGEFEFEDVKNQMMKTVCGIMTTASSPTENKGRAAVTPTGSEDEEEGPTYSKENLEKLRDALINMLKVPNQHNEPSKNTKGQKRKLTTVGNVKKRGRPAGAIDRNGLNKSINDRLSDEESSDADFTDEQSTDDESEIYQRVTRSTSASTTTKDMEKIAPVKPKSQGPNVIHAPDILIHPNLPKIKLEVDYIPNVGAVKTEPVEVSPMIDDICPSDYLAIGMDEP